ncbi:MAG: hypothetical protein ABR947_11500 [Solirubrobacteraceae bacterium]
MLRIVEPMIGNDASEELVLAELLVHRNLQRDHLMTLLSAVQGVRLRGDPGAKGGGG